MVNNYFFCSKPLQYYNCVNLQHTVTGRKILLVTLNFYGAKDFFNKVLDSGDIWDEIHIINGKKDQVLEGFKVNEKSKIYVDNDLYRELDTWYGFKKGIVFVYEEGIGTYGGPRYQQNNFKGFFINLAGLLGIFNNEIGFGRLTQGIYIYNKKNFLDRKKALTNKVFSFPLAFLDVYRCYQEHFEIVFGFNNIFFPKKKKILLFLTSNSRVIDFKEIYNSIEEDNIEIKIFKPHPFVGDLYKSLESEMSHLMAELLILKLIGNDNKLKVVHFNSSVALYINHKEINYENYSA